jgi:Ca2+-binding EF-hand superfamily protein
MASLSDAMEAAMKYELIALCSAALLSTAAVAGDPDAKKNSSEIFKTLDADADGKVSKEEASANASFANNFSTLDGNSDGVVTEREFRRNSMPKPDRQY